MRKKGHFVIGTAATLIASVGHVHAQDASVTVNCAGVAIPSSGTTPADVSRQSTTTIDPAPGYLFSFNPTARGTALLGFIAIGSTPRPLGDILNGFFVGGQRVLHGAMRNPSGTIPTTLDIEQLGGTFSGITLSLTFRQEILADGKGYAAITNIVKPSQLGITIDSGGAVYTAWTPPAPVTTEWQFQGDLRSVKETGAAPASGPSKLQYLDNPAFGPILGGVGAEDTLPSPATPTGVTQTQSAFGTIDSFGLPPIGSGSESATDGVYRTSSPRNAGDPSNTAKSRGLGLTLWPNTRDFWPDERIGQWTMVWDILIPQASWDAGRAAGGQVIPLVEDSQNNNSIADAFLLVTGAGSGSASVGHSVVPASATPTPVVQPGQWFRLALVVDHYGKQQSRIFINGVLAGTSGSDWVYNALKSTSPAWGDVSSTNPNGTPISNADWNAWGQFPSPWAEQSAAPEAPTASTVSLFADITGKGESVFVANMLFTDEAMSDAQVATLGGPNARGIVYLRAAAPVCTADVNQSGGVTADDIFAFLDLWFAQNGQSGPGLVADFNGNLSVTADDIFAFLDAWFAQNGQCPP